MYVDKKLYSGGAAGREDKEARCYALLDSLAVAYCRVDHEHADSIECCKEVETMLGCPICKNLFLCNRQQTDFYLLAMPGSKPFKTKLLSKQIGVSRLSFADAEHMEKYLDIQPGSVSVLGLMNDMEGAVRLLIDRDLLSEQYFGCHPCLNTSSLRISTDDLIDRVLPALGHEPTYVELPWEPEA